MGRSVSRPTGATSTVFLQHGTDEAWQWNDLMDCIKEVLMRKFPSLREENSWLGREDHVVLGNCHCAITISDYCGVAAVCCTPRAEAYRDPTPLAQNWCDVIDKSFVAVLHKAYPKMALWGGGHMSNGCQVYTPVGRPEGVVTSNEGTLW